MDNKYKYFYEKSFDYCYKDTDILINKLNITNNDDLHNAERGLVALRIYDLSEKPLKGNFDFSYLKAIHKYLFQDIYDWAGKIRKCNIAKQDLFCLSEHIDSFGKEIFKQLKKEKFYVIYNYETKISKLVNLFADINALHPFREGNGRSQREFIESLAKINGIMLDLTQVSKKDMIMASHDSINGNYGKLLYIFNSNAKQLTLEKQKEYINTYCSPKIHDMIFKNLNK